MTAASTRPVPTPQEAGRAAVRDFPPLPDSLVARLGVLTRLAPESPARAS